MSDERPAPYAVPSQQALDKIRAGMFRRGMRQADVYDDLTGEIIARICGPGSSGVDVGAAVGTILRQIVAAAPEGRHHAFEPVPPWAADLRREFPGVHVWEAAVADRDGSATFSYVTTNPFLSALRPSSVVRESNEVIDEVTVRTVRLDDVIPPDDPVAFVKIDVEGAEVGVLRGAAGLVQRCHPVIVVEHGGSTFTRGYGTTTDDFWSLVVDEFGYRLHRMAGWLAGDPPLSRDDLTRAMADTEFQFVAAPMP